MCINYSVTMVQNALVQGFTWYTLKIIIANQSLLFKCTVNVERRSYIYIRFTAIPDYTARRFSLINYLPNVYMFMCHNFTYSVFYCRLASSLQCYFAWKLSFFDLVVSFCWFHFNCLFSSPVSSDTNKIVRTELKMQSMSLLFWKYKFIKFIECTRKMHFFCNYSRFFLNY